jgi:hypothetical protein
MPDDYRIALSRTPDGQVIVTTDPEVPLAHACIVGPRDGPAGTVFIRLDVSHKGRQFPVWYCAAEERAAAADWQQVIDERRPEIIEAIKRWEAAHHL